MTKLPRKICVVTGSRAEYGLLYWLLKEIQAQADLALQLIVTGMHLSPQFGMTVHQIEGDGFAIDARVDMQVGADSPAGLANSIALGITGMTEALGRLKPDALVVLGDRFEIFAAAQAAMLLQIPIAHIHGGERTEGVIDEAIRHAVTKMAHLHFVAADEYRERVIQLGEAPERVWNVGAPGLDGIRRLPLLDRPSLSAELDFDLGSPYLLVTYHPVTLERQDPGIVALFAAFEKFPKHKFIITGVNADPGHSEIAGRIDAFARAHADRVLLRTSLGQRLYLSALKHADAVVGNSSSALIEAPALKVPAVNIGDRQRGRLRAANVIDAAPDAAAIEAAIAKALSAGFRNQLANCESPFGDGHASEKIVRVLREVPLDGILTKTFRDIR